MPDLNASDGNLLTVFDVVAVDCSDRGAAASEALIEQLREISALPIVVLDGGLGTTEIAQLFHAGAQDYFSQPFNLALIAERLEHLANTNHARRPLMAERSQ